MRITWDSLNSRVAKRIVLSFLLAALIPLLLFAGGAYYQVSHELHKRGLADSRALALQMGMDTLDRLHLIRDQLTLMAEAFEVGSDLSRSVERLSLADRINRLFWVDANRLLPPGDAGPVSTDLLRQLRERSLVSAPVAGVSIPDSRLFLRVRAPIPDEDWLLVAEINRDFLWVPTGIQGRRERVCVLDENAEPLHCNQAVEREWLELVARMARSREPPREFVAKDEQSFLTAVWNLHLKPKYAVDYWYFAVGAYTTDVLRPVSLFRTAFPAAALFVLCVSLLLSIRLVRGNLQPLERILQATRRLGEGDFSARADVSSNDEFELVGEAFDQAAAKLGHNFQLMRVMSGLDEQLRSVSSVRDAMLAVQATAAQLADAPGVMVMREPDGSGLAVSMRAREQQSGWRVLQDATLPRQVLRGRQQALQNNYAFLAQIGAQADDRLLVMPVLSGGSEVIAVLVLINAGLPEQGQEMALLQQMLDVLGMVVHNLTLTRRLYFQAKHDPLTGLLNRTGLREHYPQLRARMRHQGGTLAVLIFDLDHFKDVNDSQGHAAGDRLLVDIAERLNECVASSQDVVISRFSGDEFVLLVGCEAQDEASNTLQQAVQRLDQAFAEPFTVAGRPVVISASKGVALCRSERCDFDDLLQKADMAMYRAKTSHSGELSYYDEELSHKLQERLDIERGLKSALAAGELEVFYQPIVDAASGDLYAAEALLRWNRGGQGMVSPGLFIPIAEEIGVVQAFGRWIFEQVCRDLVRWGERASGRYVSINLSALQIEDETLPQQFAQIMQQTGVDPASLVLEITETAVMKDSAAGTEVLQQLQALGLKLLVDDFGTGHASLKYLRNLPIDGVKVDRMFVSGLPNNLKDAAIVSAVATLARDMELRVVVEGVETREQAGFLLGLGLPVMQGYLFSRPLPTAEFEGEFLQRGELIYVLP